MSALMPDQTRSMRDIAAKTPVTGEIAKHWDALHRKAAQLAQMAELSAESITGELATFPARAEAAAPWQRDLISQGLEDMEAMMSAGMVALATLGTRAHSAHAPALALWREFYNARAALLEIIDPAQGQEPA